MLPKVKRYVLFFVHAQFAYLSKDVIVIQM